MGTKKILIVDDSDFFLTLGKSFFKKTGCEVLTSGSGSEALQVIREEKPNIIIMDLHMPDMSGYDCCKNIKSSPITKDIPLIMVLGENNEEDIEKSFDAGCDDYVIKPLDKLELLKKVKKQIALVAREEDRIPIYLKLTYSSDDEIYDGEAYFISKGGIFIKGKHLLPVGSAVKLRFTISSAAQLVEVEGNVAWNKEDQNGKPKQMRFGMGITFLDINDEGKEAIAAYLEKGTYLM